LGPFGLAAAGPQFPSLGIAGYALGGGHGWLSSKLGWGSDTLVSADIVTAAGELVHADGKHHPDLFWALRGAGHNFGVAVRLQFTVIPLATATFGVIWFDPDHTASVLESYREWILQAPDELTTIISVAHPPGDLQRGLDERRRNRACCHVILCHCGDPGTADHDLAAMTSHPHVIAGDVQRRSWTSITTGADPFPSDVHRRSRMHYVTGLDDDVVATTVQRAQAMGELCFMSTHHYGGALRRIDEHATAMSHRGQAWNYMVTASWNPGEDGEPARRWQEEYLDEIATHSTGAYYVNYLFDEPDHVQAAYNPATWTRLRTLKHVWDPTNLFAANQNIPPADPAAGTEREAERTPSA
jgi:FAD/FMN-containing dehydrogenase